MKANPIETVRAWHEALNAGNIERLVALCSAGVEVGGPRGSGHGADVLREWFGRAGVHIEPRRFFHRDHTVVVERDARWPAPGSGQLADAQAVTSVFVVHDGRVTSVVRYPDLGSALQAAGLSEADHAA